MAVANVRILNHELLYKDPDMVPKQAPLIILDIKSAVCMDNNGKGTKHTINISRRMLFLRNDKECNLHKTVWCERGMKLADI